MAYARSAIVLVLLGLAGLPARADDPAAPLGKQRAAASRLAWDIGDAIHPSLGSIRHATLRNLIETRVGNATVYTRASFACDKAGRTFSIELTNGASAQQPRGFKHVTEPRLFCNRPEAGKLIEEEILGRWELGRSGDAIAWGLRPFPLRECAYIRVVEEVTLPEGWEKKSARVEMELLPYSRELDSIFASCGEDSAYGSAPPPPAVTAVTTATTTRPPAAAPPPPPPPPPRVAAAPAAAGDPNWKMARSTPSGKTNVRAGPNLQSSVVIELHPGSVVMVQGTGTEWWKARQSSGVPWEGYIRQDRLVFK
jgi:SH3 domain-containing protein